MFNWTQLWNQILVWAGDSELILAWATFIGAFGAVWTLILQNHMASTSWKLDNQWRLTDRFDSPHLRAIRKKVGGELTQGEPSDDIEEILDFFQEVGELLEKNFIDERMTWHNFSHWALCYWAAGEQYVKETREEYNDPTYWREAEYLIKRLRELDIKETKGKTKNFPSEKELAKFAKAESTLL